MISTLGVLASGCRSPEPVLAPSSDGHAASAVDGHEGEDLGWSAVTSAHAAPLSADAPSKRLVAEAVRQLKAMRSTRYRHKTNIDEASGTFEYDCSGFVAYALWNTSPEALTAVPIGPKGRARAEDFTNFFADLAPTDPIWESVPHATSLREGDVVAWLRPDDVDNGNTGHIVIVLSDSGAPPRRAPSSPAVTAIGGTEELLVRVVDSTESPHADDVRGKSTTTGLGTGTIGLVLDASGTTVGYRWRGGESTKAHGTKVAMGRLRPAK